MCLSCNHKYGSTTHLVFWAKYWFKKRDWEKLKTTLYHLVNRKAYRKWMNKYHQKEHFCFGFVLCKSVGHTECPEEYVNYIADLDATDTLNEYYEL